MSDSPHNISEEDQKWLDRRRRLAEDKRAVMDDMENWAEKMSSHEDEFVIERRDSFRFIESPPAALFPSAYARPAPKRTRQGSKVRNKRRKRNKIARQSRRKNR